MANEVRLASGLPDSIAPGRYRMTFSATDWVNTGEVPWSPGRLRELEVEMRRRGVNARVLAVHPGTFTTHGGTLKEDDFYADFTFDLDLEVKGPALGTGLGIVPVAIGVVVIVVAISAVLVAGITLLAIKELGPVATTVVAGSAGLIALVILAGVGYYLYRKSKSGGG